MKWKPGLILIFSFFATLLIIEGLGLLFFNQFIWASNNTGSMEPMLQGYSIVLVTPNIEKLEKGDVVIYSSKIVGNPVIHRIVDISEKGYRICGDNLDGRLCELVQKSSIKLKLTGYWNI